MNLEDIQNPNVIRKFGYLGNVHEEVVSNGKSTAFNSHWIINESQTSQGISYSIDFFKVSASSKLMPYYSF